MDPIESPPVQRAMDRRTVLRLGGLTLSIAGLVAACGPEEDTDPGRVGVAPSTTALPDYEVDDVVLLRTATSVELTIVSVYEEILSRGVIDADWTELLGQLVENHSETAVKLQELTIAAGGEAWDCTNPWMVERTIGPIVEAIDRGGDITGNVVNAAITLENLAAANNQLLAATLRNGGDRQVLGAASAQAGRNSATIVIRQRGSEGYVNPAPNGEVVYADDGSVLQFAVPSVFGSLAAIELVIVVPDVDGGSEDFLLQIPAENAYIYNELQPSC